MIQNDFIGIYDSVLTQNECNDIIRYFEEMKKLNLVFDRQTLKDGHAHEKQDETCFPMELDEFYIDKTHPTLKLFFDNFWPHYEQYVKKHSILATSVKHGALSVRIQKTPVGGGYHPWHYENDCKMASSRMIAFMLYLNSVPIGGETEFLYQHKRVNAVQGRAVIWPSGFTHTHRGNPPLSNEKYIITGWLEWMA
jgi:hypothetical protein